MKAVLEHIACRGARLATGRQQGSGVNEDISFTLTATDEHGVCYALGGFADYRQAEVTGTLKAAGGAWNHC